MEPATVLIVATGKDSGDAERVRRDLLEAGFKVAAVRVEELQQVLPAVRPALVIANLADGQAGDLDLCKRITGMCPAPIIAIGSAADEGYIIAMVEEVVDDYMTRPVNPLELVARVRSILRRIHPELVPDRSNIRALQAKPAGQPARKRRFALPGILHHFTRRDS